MDPAATDPPYLAPYRRAARAHGAGFGSLLWASPSTQAARFEAIARIHPLEGKSLLDVGCGRADLLDFLRARGVRLADYIGIEAVDELADAAARKQADGVRIIRADFVQDPARMFVGADVVVFSGSLNTADDEVFYATLRRAYDAAAEAWCSTISARRCWPGCPTSRGGDRMRCSVSPADWREARCRRWKTTWRGIARWRS